MRTRQLQESGKKDETSFKEFGRCIPDSSERTSLESFCSLL